MSNGDNGSDTAQTPEIECPILSSEQKEEDPVVTKGKISKKEIILNFHMIQKKRRNFFKL